MSTTTTAQVFTRGIYHSLPTYPHPHQSGPFTAIITGANGISGSYMLRVLSQSPERWKKIYCLSRRPPLVEGGLPPNAEHVAVDFLKPSQEIADVLRKAGVRGVDYVFFFSYIQVEPKEGGGLWSDAEEMSRVNTLLLTNFLDSLPLISPRSTVPKRILLQTGAKNYGVHLGPTKLPQTESDPLHDVSALEPNFYYAQESALADFCSKHSNDDDDDTSVSYLIAMPGPIVGAVPDAAMNLAFPLAVYATISKAVGEEMRWPGDERSWQANCSMSGSMMNAYLEEYLVLTPEAGGEGGNVKYNAFDGGAFTWEEGWPVVASWFGVGWKGPERDELDEEESSAGNKGGRRDGDGDGKTKWRTSETRFNPRGYGGRGVVKRKFTLVDWAKREDVRDTWKKLAEEHDLREKELRDVERVFGFLDGSLCRAGALLFSSSKVRKLGFHGFVDSHESLHEVMQDMARLKMIPPLPSQ